MPSRVGPRQAGQSVVERVTGDAARVGRVTMTQAQATTERIVLFFIRFREDSFADTGMTGKQL
jgi:hypothetical protein